MASQASASRRVAEAVIARFVLPISGIAVALRQPTGADDLLIAEATGNEAMLAVEIAQRLGSVAAPTDWGALSVADLDVLILRLRQAVIGNRIVADVVCHAPNCGSRIDISFDIEGYLMHQRRRRPPFRARGSTVAPDEHAAGWFHLAADSAEPVARFRLPTAADQIAIAGAPDAEAALARRCIRPADVPARTCARIETVMEMIAPLLSSDLQGVCPDCGAAVTARFEARSYCLQELRDRARFVYDDIDVLAQRYHWSEHAILGMPNARRAGYAELARQAGTA